MSINRNFTLSMTDSIINQSLSNFNNNCNNKFRVFKSDSYYEDCNKLKDWLLQLKIYFLFNCMLKEKKIMLTVSYLHRRAQHWFKSVFRKYFNDCDNNEELFIKFDNFKKEIHCVFSEINKKMTAVCYIQHFKQWTSIFNYITKFKKYSQFINWNDKFLMMMYWCELKDNIKDELMCDRQIISDMNDLIKIIIKIDNKLYKKIMKKKYDGENQRRAEFIFHRINENFHKEGNRFDNRHANWDFYESALIKLDSIEWKSCKKTICRNKQGNNKKDKTCYECGKLSHFTRNCCSKMQQQLNMITRCKESDEWDMIKELNDAASWDYDADSELNLKSYTMTESEIQFWEEAQFRQVKACKDQVQ